MRGTMSEQNVTGWADLACPRCHHRSSAVLETRPSVRLGIRRRRQCKDCGHRYTTSEQVIAEQANPSLADIEQKVRELQQLLLTLR